MGNYPLDWAIFNLAETFGLDPRTVATWPASLFMRTRMWLSARNQAQADVQANAEAQAEARNKAERG